MSATLMNRVIVLRDGSTVKRDVHLKRARDTEGKARVYGQDVVVRLDDKKWRVK